MTLSDNLLEQLTSVTQVGEDISCAQASQMMASQQSSFLMVEGSERRSIISQQQLVGVSGSGDLSLKALMGDAPPLVRLSANWEQLSPRQVESLCQVLNKVETDGVLVYQGEETLGVLSIDTLVRFLPEGETLVSRGGPDGDINVEIRMYACGTCSEIDFPREGSTTPPECPKGHGVMRLEQAL